MSAMNKDYWTAIRLTSGSYGDAINLVANEQTACHPVTAAAALWAAVYGVDCRRWRVSLWQCGGWHCTFH